MNKAAAKELIESEYLKIMAAKFGITGDEEAMEIFPYSKKKKEVTL